MIFFMEFQGKLSKRFPVESFQGQAKVVPREVLKDFSEELQRKFLGNTFDVLSRETFFLSNSWQTFKEVLEETLGLASIEFLEKQEQKNGNKKNFQKSS